MRQHGQYFRFRHVFFKHLIEYLKGKQESLITNKTNGLPDYLSVCVSVCLPTCLPFRLSLYVCLLARLPVRNVKTNRQMGHLIIYLCDCQCLSAVCCLPLCQSGCLPVCLSVCFRLFVYLSFFLFICPSVFLPDCLLARLPVCLVP